jgi:hypothetical protein
MKKKIFLSIAIVALLSGTIVRAANPTGGTLGYIHYKVNVFNNLPAGTSVCPSVVVLTDAQGNAVSGFQPYKPSVISYHFYEMGPVNGFRVARILNVPFNQDILCPVTPLPAEQRGTFVNGQTYNFSLYYGVRPPSPIPAPVAER